MKYTDHLLSVEGFNEVKVIVILLFFNHKMPLPQHTPGCLVHIRIQLTNLTPSTKQVYAKVFAGAAPNRLGVKTKYKSFLAQTAKFSYIMFLIKYDVWSETLHHD